ncbi:MAG: T9SS type A sorting domain-containing protein, partial [Saprospiraceae bacterium]
VNNQFQGRPFSQYVTEFPALLDSAIRYAGGNPDHVFVVSIPDYAYTPFGEQSSDPDEISMQIDEYNAYNRQVAEAMGVTYFDITPISRLGLINPSYVASDGLHPSGIQYTEWVKLMLGLIDDQLSGNVNPEMSNSLDVNISPNPASNLIRIEFEKINSVVNASIKIFNSTGTLVVEKTINQNPDLVSIRNLHDGLYFVSITSGQQHILKKLIIKSF